jgi:ribosomal protein S14
MEAGAVGQRPRGEEQAGEAAGEARLPAWDGPQAAGRGNGVIAPAGTVRAYAAGSHSSHLVDASGASLCGAHPRAGRRWLGGRSDRERAMLAKLGTCRSCLRAQAVAEQLAEQQPPPGRTGVIGFVVLGTIRYRVAECGDCGRQRPVARRGLCNTCVHAHVGDGTITEFGWTRADRLAEYAALRRDGLGVAEASARAGVSRRTGERYEASLNREREAA